jgi:hypothetical protein
MENFIFEGYLEDDSLCDRLIEYHKMSNPQPGIVSGGVRPEVKDSLDCSLLDPILKEEYTNALQKITNKYISKFPSCNMYAPWGLLEAMCIQYYAPGGGFKVWHAERTDSSPIATRRHLVFMTYLNDVTDQGGTEFMNQKLTTTAVKGKTLIWPADWTHTHRGVISPTQEKFIVTGWYSFTQ